MELFFPRANSKNYQPQRYLKKLNWISKTMKKKISKNPQIIVYIAQAIIVRRSRRSPMVGKLHGVVFNTIIANRLPICVTVNFRKETIGLHSSTPNSYILKF